METKLIELLKLCIDKGLTYNYSAHVRSITIYNPDDMDNFRYYAYIDFEPEMKTMELTSLNELIEKVKNYKK